MYKHIVVPVDGSATAMLAVEHAVGLAQVLGSQVTAVYVVDPYPFTGVGADFAYGQAQYLTAAKSEATQALQAVQTAMTALGLTVSTVVGEAHAVHDGIVGIVQDVGADVIVMGSHGRRGLSKWVLGSVAQRVLQASPVPVLVVKGAVT